MESSGSGIAAQLPDPLVPAHVDLAGYPGFVLDVDLLLNSELVAVGSPDECWAAMLLWCKSWRQSPPGSLPDDEKVLAAFSATGKRWPKVRLMALRGFVKCSDGRLYHKVLAQKANSAWEARQKKSIKGKAGNQARWGKPPTSSIPEGSQRESLCDPCAIPQGSQDDILVRSLCDPCASQVEVEVEVNTKAKAKETANTDPSAQQTITSYARAPPEKQTPSNTTRLAVELRALGVQITASHPALHEWLGKATHEQVLEAVGIAKSRKKDTQIPALYLTPIINDIVSGIGVAHAKNRGSGGSSGASIQADGFAQLAAKQQPKGTA